MVEKLCYGLQNLKSDAGIALEKGVDSDQHGGSCGRVRQRVARLRSIPEYSGVQKPDSNTTISQFKEKKKKNTKL